MFTLLEPKPGPYGNPDPDSAEGVLQARKGVRSQQVIRIQKHDGIATAARETMVASLAGVSKRHLEDSNVRRH